MKLMSSLCNKKMYSDQVWNTVKKFHNKRTKTSFSSHLVYKNEVAKTDSEKANVFATYFEKEVFAQTNNNTNFHVKVSRQAKSILDKVSYTTS